MTTVTIVAENPGSPDATFRASARERESVGRTAGAARHAGLLQADGYVQRSGQVIHVLAKRLFDLSELLAGYELRSRDFH